MRILERAVDSPARLLARLGIAPTLALLVACKAPVAAEPAQPNEPNHFAQPFPPNHSAQPGVLGSWLPAIVHRVAASGEATPANNWDAILWLPKHSPRDASHYSYSSASEYLSSIGSADQRAAIITLSGPLDRRPVPLGRATLSAHGAPPQRQIAIKTDGGFYQPSYVFAFPSLDPTWHQLEFRASAARGSEIVVHFVRPSTCDDFVNQYRRVLDWGTGSCKEHTDCTPYGGLDPANICSAATNRDTARKLRRIYEMAQQRKCRRPYACTTTRARCVAEVCRK